MMGTHSHMDSCQEEWIHASAVSTSKEDGAEKLQKCLMTSRDSNSAPPHTCALDYRTTPARTERRSQAVWRRRTTKIQEKFRKFGSKRMEGSKKQTYRLTHSLLPSPCLPKPSDSNRSHHAGKAAKGSDSQADENNFDGEFSYFPPFEPNFFSTQPSIVYIIKATPKSCQAFTSAKQLRWKESQQNQQSKGDAKETGHTLPWMVRIPVQVKLEAPSYLDEHERPAGVRGSADRVFRPATTLFHVPAQDVDKEAAVPSATPTSYLGTSQNKEAYVLPRDDTKQGGIRPSFRTPQNKQAISTTTRNSTSRSKSSTHTSWQPTKEQRTSTEVSRQSPTRNWRMMQKQQKPWSMRTTRHHCSPGRSIVTQQSSSKRVNIGSSAVKDLRTKSKSNWRRKSSKLTDADYPD
ncbi:hypothetical protein B9Z55_024869 [Caenorhabditis nigoni]|uniref:Uncharacterized protein n=2 Tax=Caenorhabditis nigoni TaxID=1611254 RepID=A0A2G5SVV7_9PELO|nr:hypothetical protein B9Z55_024869 [Caenorhabditis nigoni]